VGWCRIISVALRGRRSTLAAKALAELLSRQRGLERAATQP
jgi:hypothetical protein